MPAIPVRKLFRDYIFEFIHDSRSVGILLLICTAVSLVLANLSFGEYYLRFFHAESGLMHQLHLPHSPLHIINDGLMSIFFFLAGMEIKRELLMGELSSPKKALLPGAAAVGGMLVPAGIYLLVTNGSPYQNGWGIPMATDIAFSLGVASMLGKRFPVSLKIFLTALAIIDDLGAILVIAFFYGGEINYYFLLPAAIILGVLFLFNKFKIKFGIWHIVAGFILWYAVFNSGIHATISGVLFAMMVPAKNLQRLEYTVHKFVNFIILPLFALANTAIIIPREMLEQVSSKLSIGIMLGLFIGKPAGIFLACRLVVKMKLAQLPFETSWGQVCGVGILAGIGFTMSIFISALAFADNTLQDIARIAVLLTAVFSVLVAFLWMSVIRNQKQFDLPKGKGADAIRLIK